MGLFIGASILTLLEILDYIYEARRGHVGGHHTAGGGEEGPAGKAEGSVGFLVELMPGSQALGSLPGSPD